MRLLLVILVLAAGPAQAQGIGAALGAAPQARVAAPAASPVVRPGEGPVSALMAAIAAGDVAGIIRNGGTAAQAAMAHRMTLNVPSVPVTPQLIEALEATYVRARYALADGQLAVAWPRAEPLGTGPSGSMKLGFYELPGGNQGLPTPEEVIGPPAPPAAVATLPPGPPRTLPEIPKEWLTAGK